MLREWGKKERVPVASVAPSKGPTKGRNRCPKVTSTAFEQLRLHLKLVSEGEEELPTDFIRQLGNLSPKLKITLDLISRDPSKYLKIYLVFAAA